MTLPLPTYFEEFLKEIRPTQAQRNDMATGHRVLRERLLADGKLVPGIVGTFLQGSYRRYTAVRPRDDARPDVDIIVVTRMKESEFTPAKAMACFKPFLDEYYKGKYRQQGRSFGIELSYVDLDLVITAAPSEAQAGVYGSLAKSESALRFDEGEEPPSLELDGQEAPLWKLEPLRIPDRDAGQWQDTHPLAQLRWTRQKNASCSRHFVNVVKAIKWWRLQHVKSMPERPKSYPLEHLLGDCCPDGIDSVAEGVVRTLEDFVRRYALKVQAGQTPYAPDRSVDQNVMARISAEDFAAFHAQVALAAKKAREAFEAKDPQTAAPLWQELFGPKFPSAPDGDDGPSKKGDFSPHSGGAGRVGGGRFARG